MLNSDGASLSMILYGCSVFFGAGAGAGAAALSFFFLSPPFFPPPPPPLAPPARDFLHISTFPTTAANSGWLTQVVNQRTTFPYGLRKLLSQTSLNGYSRVQASTMSAKVIWCPTRYVLSIRYVWSVARAAPRSASALAAASALAGMYPATGYHQTQAGSSTSWAVQSIQASMVAESCRDDPINPVSRRMLAMKRAMAAELKITPCGVCSSGALPVGDMLLAAASTPSVSTSTLTPLYSAAMRGAKARKDPAGANNL
mmetsp:Transcript_27091/g.76235  ORF Transcript_27091/g.76235 Transcript_27091/m.76235 type:complete len:257 (-) Transcript_27091:67-837(-)